MKLNLILYKGLKNGWQIISTKKSFAVYAATATEKAEWMAHINKCIQDLFAKSESFFHCYILLIFLKFIKTEN
jgi:hypothetical protein